MRAEFFRAADGQYVTLAELQATLDAWVAEYNTARPHQSCGGRPPAERFRFADRSITPDAPAGQPAAAASRAAAGSRPPGVSRWVNTHGKISLGGFTYAAGASYAGEPVEAVVADGLVEILHAGWSSPRTRSGSAPTRPTGHRGCRWPGGPGTPPPG